MAFTRATLRNLAKESGVELPKEFEDALISEHTTARDAYAEEQVKAELAKQPTEKAGNVKDSEEYKTLDKAFKDYKAEVAAKETKAKIKDAYKALLKKDAKLSDAGIEKAVKYADFSKFEFEADGATLKDADAHAKAAQEEWAMFVTTTTTTGAKTSNPPANNGNSGVTKEDFQKMSYKDRLQIYNENPDLYNELTT